MRRALCLATLVLAWAPAMARSAEVEEGFVVLFDGSTLQGWQGDPQLWSVANGAILGSTEKKQIAKNSFLATEASYANFVLRLKFKLRNHNSGVQYRSQSFPEFVVKGYQADIADNMFLGILYEEGGRGILANVAKPAEVATHVARDGWTDYEITANGAHLKQVLGGYTTVDYTEKDPVGAKQGIIALQLHTGPPMRIEFKDIRIKVLP